MAKNRWSLWLIQDETRSVNRISLTRWTFAAIVFVFFALAGSVTLGISKVMADWMTHESMTDMVRENQELRRQLTGITRRIKGIDGQLQDLYTSDDQLRMFADIPRIDKEVREVGIGGTVNPSLSYDEKDSTVQKLIFDLDKIEREIRLQTASFLEIQKKFKQKSDLISHTPSLRPCRTGFYSSGFGMRRDPFTGHRAFHSGLDICTNVGAPVVASADGVVTFAKRSPGFGNMVQIDHGYGFKTVYGHLNRIRVNRGERVERGQRIGDVGSTGRSTGPHLHYEVHVNNKPVDPVDYLYDTLAERK